VTGDRNLDRVSDLLNIGAFAAATGLTIPALRHYDEIGLLRPAQVDPASGYRRYARTQLAAARLICGLRAVGVPIDDVRIALTENTKAALDTHRARLAAQLRELTQRIAAVDEFLKKGTPMPTIESVRPVQLRIAVTDVPAAAAFYTEAFDVVFNESISSLQFGTYRSDRFFLITLEECEPAATTTRFGLLVDNVDTAHARAVRAGATEQHPPTEFSWKPRTSCVRDPDNNLIDLTQA
jgi:DNA-binding transcriptional MerR regulator